MRASFRGLILLTLLAYGCGGPPVDLTKGLEINVVDTGWFDAGVVDGKNKLVPTIAFTVKNVSHEKLGSLEMMASFFRVSDPTPEGGNSLLNIAGSEGLAP